MECIYIYIYIYTHIYIYIYCCFMICFFPITSFCCTQTAPMVLHAPGTAGRHPQFGAALRLAPQHRARAPRRRGAHSSNGALGGTVPSHLPVEAGALRVLQADLPSRAAGNASAGLRLGVKLIQVGTWMMFVCFRWDFRLLRVSRGSCTHL